MSDLRCGMQIMHNGRAMELLYRTDELNGAEIWMVKLLFVEPENVPELFEKDDRVSFIHSRRKCAAAAG